MERETCAFEDWFLKLQKAVKAQSLCEALSTVAERILERYGVRVWFAEILGKRWSYIAGCGGESPLPLHRILLTPRFGLVAENWNCIPSAEEEALLLFLRNFLSQTSASSGKRED